MSHLGKTLNAIGDRMLAKLLPAATAAAAPLCSGRYIGQSGNCHYYCRQGTTDHTTKYHWCSDDRR